MVENSSTIGHRLMMRLALGVWLTISFGASAEESYRKNAGDYTVYLTVMPAEIVRGPLSEESAGRSAEPARTARDTHEVIVRTAGDSIVVHDRVQMRGPGGADWFEADDPVIQVTAGGTLEWGLPFFRGLAALLEALLHH